ncbi:hypothetical protein ACJRO7_027402 [Eucalyptus globulus]|uniref:Uncharacterized protein n=1 Tax=Eucalyptus globulus TaxID=34317 RepID=A0ABD3JR18_EUCGL
MNGRVYIFGSIFFIGSFVDIVKFWLETSNGWLNGADGVKTRGAGSSVSDERDGGREQKLVATAIATKGIAVESKTGLEMMSGSAHSGDEDTSSNHFVDCDEDLDDNEQEHNSKNHDNWARKLGLSLL